MTPSARAEAGVPEQVRFATKPQLASRMIEAAVRSGLPCRWAAGDAAYGNDPRLAARLRQLRAASVASVPIIISSPMARCWPRSNRHGLGIDS